MVQKMRKMKDSGIEWIGEIPEGWEVAKLKNIVSIVRGGSPRPIEAYMSDNDNDVNWIRISDTEKGSKYITHTSRKLIASGISKSRFIKRGSLILTNSMSFGEPYILDIDGCIHDGWVAFSDFKKIDKEFLYYFLTSPLAKIQFEQQVDGGVVKNLNIDKIGDTVILLPSLIDQNKVIAHLDSLTSETNSLLSKTITSIEEYKKLKQAVITQAVTKGVRGEREMKDSGVEWIGEIPAEWSITKIKSGVTKIGSGKTPSGGAETYTDSGVIFLRSQNIYDCTLNLESPTYISPEVDATMKSTRVLPDDVLLNITGGSIGRCSIVPKTLGLANVNQHVCIIRTNPLIFLPKYMQYFWVSTLGHLAIDLYQTGGNREGMSADAIRNTPIPYAPLNEQKEIADYLDAKCAEIDKLIAKKEQLVKELESYKKSLIYEVVTGKREV